MSLNLKALAFLLLIALPLSGAAISQNGGEYQPTDPDAEPEEKQLEVSEEEIEQFVRAAREAERLREESRTKMRELTEKYGIDINEYRKMERINDDPDRRDELDEEERQKLKAFKEEFTSLQQRMEAEIKEEVEATGLEMQRYQRISSAMQRDNELRERIHDQMDDFDIETH